MTTATSHEIVVVIGAGSIGQAIARRVGVGKTILLADLNEDAAKAAADALSVAGFQSSTAHVDVASAESVWALADTPASWGRPSMSFTPPACHRPKPAPRPSSTSTWSASPMLWSNSAE